MSTDIVDLLLQGDATKRRVVPVAVAVPSMPPSCVGMDARKHAEIILITNARHSQMAVRTSRRTRSGLSFEVQNLRLN